MIAYLPSTYMKRFKAACSVALLLFCLLGIHWIGFSHSISHAGLHSQSIEKCSAADIAPSITHSSDACHLFDALTLAGFTPASVAGFFSLPTDTFALIHAVDLVLIESATAAYQSQAPPTFIL